jgi:hypothetical protein
VAQENTSLHFGLIATRLVRVSGQVIMSNGAPASGGSVMLMPMNAAGGRAVVMQQGGAGNRIDGSGMFRLPSVAPGRYQVQARAGAGSGPGGGIGGPGREFELGRMDLVVGPEDVGGLTLVTAPGAVVSGTITSDTGEAFDFRPQQLQVSTRIASPELQAMGGGGPGGSRVGDDWSFSIRNVIDPVFLRTSSPQGWTLKSVLLNGQDITDVAMEFPAGQTIGGVQIVMTKQLTTLSGLVTDARGNPALDATVVVFPADDKLWTYQSRFIRAARPDQEGRYRITALPGGHDYLAVAVQGLEDGQAGDPDFLAAMRDFAAKLQLGEGETKSVDVKLTSAK